MPQPPDQSPPPRSPAAQHNPVFVWPTPNAEDRIFWVEKDLDLPKNKAFEYGDAYPDATRYPDHRLVFVSPQTPDKWSRWYYASNRLLEDEYNFEVGVSDIGGGKFNTVTRTYLVPREDFNANVPAPNAAMATPVPGTIGNYTLADRTQTRTNDQELDSLYVLDVQIYASDVPVVGQIFAPDGVLLATTESLVVEGAAPEKGVNISDSTVEPIGHGKSVKRTRTARKRPPTGADTPADGWPKKQKKAKGTDNLTPQKFRRLITTVTLTTQESLAQGEVDDIPTPATPTGDQTLIQHEKVNDYRYEKQITEEVIVEGDPLVGQKFAPDGAVVNVSESMVAEGTPADAGFLIESSDVEPLGNGKSVKQTQSVTAWPSKQKKSKGQDNLTPAKYRGLVTTAVTTTQHDLSGADLLPEPPAPSGDQTLIELEKVNDHRYAKSITDETIEEGGSLEGEALNNFGTISTIEESLVLDAASLPTPTFLTLKSTDSPLGNGKSVREIETVENFPLLTGFRTDRKLHAPVGFTEQIVDAATATTNVDPLVEYDPVDALRTMKRTEIVPTDFLDNFVQSFPRRARMDLPRELVGVNVVWSSTENVGTQSGSFISTTTEEEYTVGGDVSDDANSSASVSPEIQLEFRDLASESLFADSYLFFMPMPVTTASVLARLGTIAGSVSKWPVFRPQGHTITATSQAIGVRVSASASGSKRHTTKGDTTNIANGISDNLQTSIEHSSVQIPPCIHGAITVTGETTLTKSVNALAVVAITGEVSASATINRSGSAIGSVYPTFLAATTGQHRLPDSGKYLIDLDVEPYQWGYAMVRADVFDAADLA